MKSLKNHQHKQRSRAFFAISFFIFLIAAVLLGSFGWYQAELRPVSDSQKATLLVVQKGASVSEIASKLQDDKLIRSAQVLQTYVKIKGLGNKFQAGTYALSPSQDIKSIVATLTKGKVSAVLVTILPGKRVDQIRSEFINDGFAPDDVDKALDPDQYSNLPIMAFKPSSVLTLEGLLWPDSFQKDQTTVASDIIKQSLMESGEHLTSGAQALFASQGLSPYQGLTLASIIEQEVSNPADQNVVAQVFYARLKKGMMLGSDVTARYGAISAGLDPSLKYDSPYNTLIHPGLPPTPISTVNTNSLNAALHPSSTNWLYFVAGDDGTTHFSSTLEEHNANTAKYCHKLCGN